MLQKKKEEERGGAELIENLPVIDFQFCTAITSLIYGHRTLFLVLSRISRKDN